MTSARKITERCAPFASIYIKLACPVRSHIEMPEVTTAATARNHAVGRHCRLIISTYSLRVHAA